MSSDMDIPAGASGVSGEQPGFRQAWRDAAPEGHGDHNTETDPDGQGLWNGGTVRSAADMQDAGMVAWLSNLRNAGEETGASATRLQEMARIAAEEQPAHPAIADGYQTAAALVGQAAQILGEIPALGRRLHDADYARVDTPRKGHNVERKADNRAARRDGAA